MPRRVTTTLIALPAALAGVLLWYESALRSPQDGAPGDIVVFAHLAWVAPFGLWALWLCWVGTLVYFVARGPGTSLVNRLWKGTLGILALLFLSFYAVKWRGASAFELMLLTVVGLAPAGLLSIVFTWRYPLLQGPLTRARVVAALLLTLEVLLFVVAMAALAFPGYWLRTAELRVPDGRTFRVMSSSLGETFYSEQRWLLAEEVSRGTLFTRTRVLARNYGTSYGSIYDTESDLPIIRPKGARQYDVRGRKLSRHWREHDNLRSGRLVISPDGRYLLYLHTYAPWDAETLGCGALFAYDLTRNSPYGWGELWGFSQFVLIGPEDELNPEDVALVRALLAEVGSPEFAIFDPDTLQRDLRHPNPRVRALVKELLGKKPSP
jgi:hypothetical protein